MQLWVNPGVFSHHFRVGEHREDNYGFGVELVAAPRHAFVAGSFINSNNERSRYAGYYWRPWIWQAAGANLGLGAMLGIAEGYSNTSDGGWFALALPAFFAEYGRLGANLILVPTSDRGTALALQLKLRVW